MHNELMQLSGNNSAVWHVRGLSDFRNRQCGLIHEEKGDDNDIAVLEFYVFFGSFVQDNLLTYTYFFIVYTFLSTVVDSIRMLGCSHSATYTHKHTNVIDSLFLGCMNIFRKIQNHITLVIRVNSKYRISEDRLCRNLTFYYYNCIAQLIYIPYIANTKLFQSYCGIHKFKEYSLDC